GREVQADDGRSGKAPPDPSCEGSGPTGKIEYQASPRRNQRGNSIHILGKRMLAGDEVAQWPPKVFIDEIDDRSALHQCLNRSDFFERHGIDVEIAVANRENGTAPQTGEPTHAPEKMLGVVRRIPTGDRSSADRALE